MKKKQENRPPASIENAFVIYIIGAFTAGGVVSMVSAAMMPETFEEGGPIVGIVASLGLLSSLVLNYFE